MYTRFQLNKVIERDRFIRKPSVKIIIAFAVAITFCTPENIFLKFPALYQLYDLFVVLVPSIDRFSNKSHFPDATKMLLMYSWSAFPFLLFMNFNFLRKNRVFIDSSEREYIEEFYFFSKDKKSKAISRLIGITFMSTVLLYVFYTYVFPEGGRTYNMLISSRVVTFVYIFGTLSGLSFLIPFAFYNYADMVKIVFFKKD